MYRSRYNLSNGLINLAVDEVTGAPLEITLESTGENIIKNHIPSEATPLRIQLTDGRLLRPATRTEVEQDPALRCTTVAIQTEGDVRGTFRYDALIDEQTGETVAITAEWTARLPAGSNRILWQCDLRSDIPMQKLWFPQVCGLWMGDDWTQDELFFPKHSGDRTVNPTEVMSAVPPRIGWNWQGYHFNPSIGGPYGWEDGQGRWFREMTHSGSASMLYMALQNRREHMIVSLAGTQDTLKLKGVSVSTRGRSCPGISLAITHFLPRDCTAARIEPVSLLVAEGDWHLAADDYRAMHPERKPAPRPDWFLKSPGLVAHYDFKYQDGGIVHRFTDIPALFEQAQSFGLDHLMLSGWNIGGFDNGFPMYRPDPDLGTAEELRDAVHAVRAAGGHVAFYINSRLFNLRYAKDLGFHEAAAIRDRDGNIPTEQYGDRRFAVMCNGAAEWQAHLADTIAYLTQYIGADSMYLDQLSMAPGQLCYNPAHRHGTDITAWNEGYNQVIETVHAQAKEELALLFEGASDTHAYLGCGQLVTTMFTEGAFPELYKYTYPDDVLVDMMVAPAHSGMRPAHLARRSIFLLDRAFCTGSYLWVYDLEEDNTFRRSPEKLAYLRALIALRRVWLERYGQGTFTDVLDFSAQAPENAIIKGFRLNGALLIAIADPDGEVLRIRVPDALSAVLHTVNAPQEAQPLTVTDGCIEVKERLCFIVAKVGTRA